jgi:hypothetical protein
MSGTIPPFPNTPSWRGAQLKHRDNLPLPLHANGSNICVGLSWMGDHLTPQRTTVTFKPF